MNLPADPLICPCCGGKELQSIYRLDSIPTTSNLLITNRDEATHWPRKPLTLKNCRSCDFIFNANFDPATQEHSARYEASQAYSPTFSGYAKTLAEQWRDRHKLSGKKLLEIGCLQGEFITQMCEACNSTGIGIDPALDPSRTPPQSKGKVEFIKDYYGPKHTGLPADFICCRHTLEHIARPHDFMRSIREAIGDRKTIVGIEVPDTDRVLEEGAFWDIYYEHCSYFNARSLRSLLRKTGFEIVHESLEYDGQYLVVDAVPAQPGEVEPAADAPRSAAAHGMFSLIEARVEWDDLLHLSRINRVAVWGSGSKAVGFLSTLDLSHDFIPFVVDINPNKRGTFLPGTGQQIITPDELKAYNPQIVIAMNPIYRSEISKSLEQLDIHAELFTL
jgi:hypothetical protein